MGLNFTSTNPSLTLVSSLMHTGYVAWPDCLSTFGLLGAVLSTSIVHFASPVPVLVAVQPGGGAPAFRLSKLTESASATTDSNVVVRMTAGTVFIEASDQTGLILARISSQRIPAKRARVPPAPRTLQRGNDRKSPRHAAMPSHETMAHAKR